MVSWLSMRWMVAWLGAVSGAVLGVAGEGSRGLAVGEPNKQ